MRSPPDPCQGPPRSVVALWTRADCRKSARRDGMGSRAARNGRGYMVIEGHDALRVGIIVPGDASSDATIV